MNCPECNKEFLSHKENVVYCSSVCCKRFCNRLSRERQKYGLSKNRAGFEQALITEYNVIKKDVERRKGVKLIKFLLSLDEFKELVIKNCCYCGESPKIRTRVGTYKRSSIDRINSLEDYIIENCVSACWTCNKMKNTLSPEEFIVHIDKIHKWNYSECNK